MDIQAEKIELIKLLLNTDNISVLESVKNIFKQEKVDFWNTLPENEQAEINLGIEQLNNGKRILFDDFLIKTS